MARLGKSAGGILSDVGATMEVNGVDLNESDFSSNYTLSPEDVVKVKAGSGTKFFIIEEIPNSYNKTNKPSCYFKGSDKYGTPLYVWASLSEEDTVATLAMDTIKNEFYNLKLSVEQAAKPVYVLNNIYNVTPEQISGVMAERFLTEAGGDGTGGISSTTVDYGQYILSLLRVPFSIPEEYVNDTDAAIKLGNRTLEITSKEILDSEISVSLGEISIPRIENNYSDFEKSCKLNLPFTPSISLDSRYCIGQTIEIEYILSCYSGAVTLNLKSTKISGEVFHSEEISLGVEVPYSSQTGRFSDTVSVSSPTVKPGGNNHILVPFIEVSGNEIYDSDNFFKAVVPDSGTLQQETGFVVVEDISLNFDSLGDEKDDIKSILSQGVVIK